MFGRGTVGAWAGAIVGLLVSIAYNTSASTSLLEGGRRHIPFLGVLLIAGVGAIVGRWIALNTNRR